MILRERDWDKGNEDAFYAYPDAPLEQFLNFLRRSTAWREDKHLLNRKLNELDVQLAQMRRDGRAKRVTAGHTPAAAPQTGRQLAAARARAARAEKRARDILAKRGEPVEATG